MQILYKLDEKGYFGNLQSEGDGLFVINFDRQDIKKITIYHPKITIKNDWIQAKGWARIEPNHPEIFKGEFEFKPFDLCSN